MARISSKRPVVATTFEGGPVFKAPTKEQELRRAVLTCLLWENEFYRKGHETASRIQNLAKELSFETVAKLAVEARSQYKLRHVPLWLLVAVLEAGHKGAQVSNLIAETIQRPDEMAELLSLWWKNGKRALPAQLRKGLAKAFVKFNEYQLAKFDKPGVVKLCDVMALSRPKPETEEQAAMFKRVADRALVTPDTWEVALSSGADKKATWERLVTERKLGPQATLKNLRNMLSAGVDESIIRQAINQVKTERVLPFEFITAARYAKQFEPELEQLMFKGMAKNTLKGKTVLLVDVSGSMMSKVSDKSELSRFDAAAALAMLLREECEIVEVYAFNTQDPKMVAPRRGFALRDAIPFTGGGTEIGRAVDYINRNVDYDRIMVFTDEQSSDRVAGPKSSKAYMINVATYEYTVNNGAWTSVNGFSEAIVDYIKEHEKNVL